MIFDYLNREGLDHFYSKLKTYLSSKYTTKEELEEAIRNFGGFQVVSLNQQGYPDVASPSTKIIYLTKEAGSSKTDPYTEWIYASQGGSPETFAWEIIGEATPEINEMIGATASTAGTAGLVPAPAAGDQDKVLAGDGTWRDFQIPARVSYDAQNEELSLDFSPPPTVNIGSRSYPCVQIGNQLWMAENLDWKFDGLTFRDGTSENEFTSDASIVQGAYYDYDELTYGASGNKYGMLYNWTAVAYINDHLSELGIPSGWHIPSNDEFNALITACNSDSASKLKSTTGWSNSGNGIDSFGFNLVPSGMRIGSSSSSIGSLAFMWSSDSPDDTHGNAYWVGTSSTDLGQSSGDKPNGWSIRLVKTLT